MTTATLHRRGPRAARADPGKPAAGAVVLGGDYQGLGIARSLGRHGISVCVVDDERSIAAVSRYTTHRLRVPELRSAGATLAALDQARERFGLAGWVVYPTRDETVAVLAAHREALRAHFRVPTPAWDCIEQAWDKRCTYRLAEQLGIPVPRTWCPRTEADLAEVDTSVPLVIKPAIKEHFFYATHAKGWRVGSRDELVEAFRRGTAVIGADGELLVQEMIPGGSSGQRSYCALFKDGAAVATMTVARRRQHPSDLGRASTFVETVEDPLLAQLSVRFLEHIGYYGLVELEYKVDPRDGVPKLLDVNARTWGYHTLGPAAGVDFPYMLFRDQVGEVVVSAQARPGVRWLRLTTDVPNALRDLRRGELDLREYLGTLRGVDTEAVFALRDPLPGLYEIALLPYLAVRRGI
jgi:predicted ATP-grasp superfamily ATP-dependent carboligase